MVLFYPLVATERHYIKSALKSLVSDLLFMGFGNINHTPMLLIIALKILLVFKLLIAISE